ncbi:hypothetical protein PTSG_00170 [Salpingoeca rosetta]|uniref:PH domain-containing protein n=1 Tax=Salpingoeca rosetta (strain ATCC 50818 / BSB-021) TaxID=946362 RepID=F2TVQ3_SALR5|nr:uncharacterized protein PTSG_00170 [Salpingoeca rosetta]EGD72149.1 hypothetical protein PTSG_00170 [Salpingoeca rosetta]|eukprot:XP_004998721.1 hypothetical protein PTSG_00170 [Salpingoeca rosetta]
MGEGDRNQHNSSSRSSTPSGGSKGGGDGVSPAEASGTTSPASASASVPRAASSVAMRLDQDQSLAFLQQLRRKRLTCIDEIKALKDQLKALDDDIREERERLGVDDPETRRKAILDQAIALFNEKPKRGIAFLKQSGYFHDDNTCTTDDIAQLLHSGCFAKTAIGEYIGDNKKEKSRGGSKKTWRTRWVVLKDQCLYYFKHKDDAAPCGIVPLEKAFAQPTDTSKKRARDSHGTSAATSYFEVVSAEYGEDGKRKPVRGCKTNAKGMVVAGNHQRYLFRATSPQEAADWVARINGSNDMFSMLQHKIGAKRATHDDSYELSDSTMFDTSQDDSMFVIPIPGKSQSAPPSATRTRSVAAAIERRLSASTSMEQRSESSSSIGTNISISSRGPGDFAGTNARPGRPSFGGRAASILEEMEEVDEEAMDRSGDDSDHGGDEETTV